ncbi:DUF2202 domain-containing protein [Magnetospira sp. QH-2]|uniref:DUF2202 domain-containing protein n=1 Tax=Magnetospira sp. (strain QH-2) TaxID=1288970 RepID=UPI0003E81A69|nr:DUF2202 domain-containing protein [Magnetospira sp. QH-2]CCQ75410.1 conserved exported protein of unknown function [Magnetospira sp. QH-2]
MTRPPRQPGSNAARSFIVIITALLIVGGMVLALDAVLQATNMQPVGAPRANAPGQHVAFPLSQTPPAAMPSLVAGGTPILTEREVQDLLYMREEEKLARDVYLDLFDRWQLPIFQKIASAEQRHMDALLRPLTRYGLIDPAQSTGRGEFQNVHLQKLYRDLSEKSKASLQAALNVGGLIEEVDIADLDKAIESTAQADIKQVYTTIRRGSRNHLRSFAGQLNQRGGTYKPQLLDAARVRDILSTPMELGPPGGGAVGRAGGRGF